MAIAILSSGPGFTSWGPNGPRTEGPCGLIQAIQFSTVKLACIGNVEWFHETLGMLNVNFHVNEVSMNANHNSTPKISITYIL
jgi:hypothetical protein